MRGESWLRLRLLIAGLFGLGVAFITFCIAARVAVANGVFTGEQTATRAYIIWMGRTVNDYRAENKTFPPDLQTVWPGEPDQPPMVDGWKRPLLYSVRNNRLLIQSLGRDGIPGGVGLDADLSNLNSRPTSAALPLAQQLEHPLGRTFIAIALLCGVLAAAIVFPTLGRIPVDTRSWPLLALQLVLTFLLASLMAAVGAMFIAAAHIPSGH